MAETDTIRRVARPRGTLNNSQTRRLDKAADKRAAAEAAYRAVVVGLLHEGCSFSELSKATGLSTSTLQKWKRES